MLLWAMQYYQKTPIQIRNELAYLKTGMMRQTEFNDEVLETIRKKIVDDFEQMNLNYEMNNYPASPEPRKCISCQFGTVCPESKIKDYLKG